MTGLVAVPRMIWAGAGALAIVAVAATAGSLFELAWTGGRGLGIAALAAGACVAGLAAWSARQVRSALAAVSSRVGRLHPGRTLVVILLAGIALRLAAVAAVDQVAVLPDGEAYLQLAWRLAEGGGYVDRNGDLAFWPPGYPLLLAALGNLLGPERSLAVVVVLNMGSYVVAALAAYVMGAVLFGRAAGLGAAAVVSVCPSLVLATPVVSRGLAALALLTLCVALYVYARAREEGRLDAANCALLLICGLMAGSAGLVQPALLALPVIFAAGEVLHPSTLRAGVFRLGLLCVGAMLVVVPWLARNEQVLGITASVVSSGGVVFYRANDPQAVAGGGETQVSLMSLPEQERSAQGYRLAAQWIAREPHRFLLLCWERLLGFASGDSATAASAPVAGDGRMPVSDPVLAASGSAAGLAIWLLVLVALASGAVQSASPPGAWVVAAACLCVAAMSSIAGGDSHDHVSIAALLAVLGSAVLAPARVPGHGAVSAGARPPLMQFIDFAAVGVVGTSAHFATLIFLVQSYGWAPTTATTAGFLVGAIVNYALNHRLTFRSNAPHLRAAPRFLAIAFFSMLLNLAIVWLLVVGNDVHYLIGQAVSTLIVLVVNFVANRILTFGAPRAG